MFFLLLLCLPFLTAFFYNGNSFRNIVLTPHKLSMYMKDYDNAPFLNLLNYNLGITKN